MRTKKANRKTRTPRARKSMKGVWGKKGAPPKDIRWPKGPFDYQRLFKLNVNPADPKKPCELTLRTKTLDGRINLPDGSTNADGILYQLTSKKHAKGKVGRPIDMFVLKADYDPATMTLKGDVATPVRVTVKATAPVAVTPAVPAVAPTANVTPARPAAAVTFGPGMKVIKIG